MTAFSELSLDAATSLPRSNGELVFVEPWESRAFGMAVALADQKIFSWKDFQGSLISAIAAHQTIGHETQPYRYYERWLAALESLVVERGLVATRDIDQRVAEFICRPKGHDHKHHHSDGHGHSDDAQAHG
jgi:nitrile hydratase accessory protein